MKKAEKEEAEKQFDVRWWLLLISSTRYHGMCLMYNDVLLE
jgi:hypothetical protein